MSVLAHSAMGDAEGRIMSAQLSAPLPVLELLVGMVLEAEGGLAEAGLVPTIDDEMSKSVDSNGEEDGATGTVVFL
jgi:hypothetical protein